LLALAGLRSQYPESSETELRRRLAGLLLGEEIAYKVYEASMARHSWLIENTRWRT